MKSNQRGSALVAVLALAIILNLTLLAVYFATRDTSKKSGKRRSAVAALNIAEAGKERVLANIRNRDLVPPETLKITPYIDEPFGTGSFTVSCSTDLWLDTLFLTSIGVAENDTAQLEVIAVLEKPWKNWLRGAVTSRNPVNTLGDIIIDGRDHDTSGNVLGTGGTYGVSSGGSVVTGSAASTIGGGTTAPQNTVVDSLTVIENMDTTGYPQTPEEFLGLPPGYLDSHLLSSCPSTPLSGITYIDGKCNDYTGSGILICHNSSGTANLGNFKGNFKGLILVDEDKHFNGNDTIIGAVVLLGKKNGGNALGNGTTHILYSSEMLEIVANLIPPTGRRGVTVISWKQN